MGRDGWVELLMNIHKPVTYTYINRMINKPTISYESCSIKKSKAHTSKAVLRHKQPLDENGQFYNKIFKIKYP